MEKTSALLSNISSGTHDYVQLQSKSIKLEIYERITNIISSGISAAFIILFALVCFLFVNLGIAFWLSELLKSNKLGFFTLGGFYLVVLGIYLLFRKQLAKNRVKDAVLFKVSKTMSDYDLMLKEQDVVHAQVAAAELVLKENFDELKENIHTLKEDLDNIKHSFGIKNSAEEENNHVGPKLPRMAITSAIDFAIQHVLFKNAGFIKKAILPIVTNALVTSTVFKENKKTSLVENLKLKLSKFL